MDNTEYITQSELKAALSYDKLSGLFHWLIDTGSVKTGDLAGSLDRGYIRIRYKGINYAAHRLAILYETGNLPSNECIDHDDRDKSNNAINNLIDTTTRINCSNRSSTLEVIGAYRTNNTTNPWSSSIRYLGKQVHLGYFKTRELANTAYTSAIKDIELGNYPVPTGLRKQGKGYYLETATGKWKAAPTINGKQKSIGRYCTEQEAINAVSKARADGLNDIREQYE